MKLTDSQVEWIVSDIRKKGITSVALQEDIADHICCFIEEKDEWGDFQTCYQLALRSLGTLSSLQIMTSAETMLYGRAAAFFKFFDFFFTIIFLTLGLTCFILPTMLLVFYVNIPVFAISSPLLFLGYFICFSRIDYKKFQLIPFKTRVFPDELIFS
jgi:hypothetical protein